MGVDQKVPTITKAIRSDFLNPQMHDSDQPTGVSRGTDSSGQAIDVADLLSGQPVVQARRLGGSAVARPCARQRISFWVLGPPSHARVPGRPLAVKGRRKTWRTVPM